MHIKKLSCNSTAVAYNLRVRKVILLVGPAPAPVWALSCSRYTVSGDNPSIVCISMLLPKLVALVPSYRMEYCVIKPLGAAGGLHCKVIELELIEINSNDWDSLGTTSNSNQSV